MSTFYSIAPDGTHVFYNSATQHYLYFNSNDGIQVSDSLPTIYSKLNIGSSASAISCIIGTIKLKINKYIVICDRHTIAGNILGLPIGRVESYKIIPIVPSALAKKDPEEAQYLDLLEKQLSNATLYFSVDGQYDVTNSLQRQYTLEKPAIDQRFWWNGYLSEELVASGAKSFITPLIYGYFRSHTANFNGPHGLDFALLTRRSVNRAGTRYFRRGVDSKGNVANFNETEQIFTSKDRQVYSILQTRGSVPVYWSEINNLKYKPNLVVSSQSSIDASAAHFSEQVELYGENYCVNLVNQKGYELPVKNAYENAVKNLPAGLAEKVHYIYFDFHHECSKMRWDRVKLLLEHLIDLGYTSNNYFHYDLNTRKIQSLQTKVVRTNCMDCLDRTNVVQSTIARWALQKQLTDAGYLSKENVTPWELLDPSFNWFFMSFWADNADAVSSAYSGTGALKTDFTRTGRRTKKGALNDLSNSITRYYKNNYKDGSRQDSYDLFLGLYKPFQDSISNPFIDRRAPYIQLLPYLMGTSFLVMLAILFYPRGSIFDLKNLFVIGGCLFFNIKSLLYVNREGYQFVNWPKLSQLDYLKKVEEYDGEGALTGIRYEELDNFRTINKKRN